MKYTVAVHDLQLCRSPQFRLDIPSMHLEPGQVLGLTGPNGSGKTTFIECLSGLLQPNKGWIAIQGKPLRPALRALRASIGYIPDDEDWLVAELCAQEYFELLKRIYTKAGVRVDMHARVQSYAALLQFSAFRQQLQSLSHGNKKKVQIIAGLMHRPALIVIDELRNGLDPMAIIAAEQLIKEEAKRGASIVAATHDLWWAQRIAEKILFIRNGAVVANEKTAVLVSRYGSLEHFFLQTMKVESDAAAIV